MPGSFLSSSINRDIGSGNRDIRQSSFTSMVIVSGVKTMQSACSGKMQSSFTFFCRVSYCALAFDIKSCRLNPPIVALPLLLVVNHRTNLRPEFFPHALHHGILFCPAAASAIGSLAGPRFCVWLRSYAGRDRCARDYLQLPRPTENFAGRSDCQ